MAITENDLKMRILETAWELNPTAKKIEDNPLTGDETQWAALFKKTPTDEIPEPSAFAFIVRRKSVKWNAMANVDRMIFQILVFKAAETVDSETSSEAAFQQIIDDLGERLVDRDSENELWDFVNEDLPEEDQEQDTAATVSVEFGRIALLKAGEYLHHGSGLIAVNIFRC